MTLRLKCIRCGDWFHFQPWSEDMTCARCIAKYEAWVARGFTLRQRVAMWQKHLRNAERHPTHKALTAALDAMESTPHGTLAEIP